MGQITGNENSFPTIKQVNDALSSVNFDISQYIYALFNLKQTKPPQEINNFYDGEISELTDDSIIKMFEEIITVKPNILAGELDNFENPNIDINHINFRTSNIEWCKTIINDLSTNKDFIITFNIYTIAFGISFHFSFFKMVGKYLYSFYIINNSYFSLRQKQLKQLKNT